jgi:hypothetical protein
LDMDNVLYKFEANIIVIANNFKIYLRWSLFII